MSEASQSRLARRSMPVAASVLLWICRTLLGCLISYPVLLAIRASAMTSGPEGDAVLFQPGSLLLLELLRIGAPWLAAAGQVALLLLALSATLELVPLAVALDMLWLPGRPLLERLPRALRIFPRFLALGAIALLVQAALLLAASLLGSALKPALSAADERLRSLAPLALLCLGLFACVGFGGVLDIARATLVRRCALEGGAPSARAALAQGLFCLRQRPFNVLLGIYPSVAGSALGILAAVWFLTCCVPTAAPSMTLALGFAAHQLGLLFGVAFRVRWLGAALDLSAESD